MRQVLLDMALESTEKNKKSFLTDVSLATNRLLLLYKNVCDTVKLRWQLKVQIICLGLAQK